MSLRSPRLHRISSSARVTKNGYIITSWCEKFELLKSVLSDRLSCIEIVARDCKWYLETDAGDTKHPMTKTLHSDRSRNDNEKDKVNFSVLSEH